MFLYSDRFYDAPKGNAGSRHMRRQELYVYLTPEAFLEKVLADLDKAGFKVQHYERAGRDLIFVGLLASWDKMAMLCKVVWFRNTVYPIVIAIQKGDPSAIEELRKLADTMESLPKCYHQK